jgi:ABC-type lipoprotein release transport system permease subunit
VSAVFAQPMRQLGIGLVAGVILVAWMTGMIKGGMPSAGQLLMLGAYGVAMTVVCMIACVVPTRRALTVEPTEALREY